VNLDLLIVLTLAGILYGGSFYLAYKSRQEARGEASDPSKETKEIVHLQKGGNYAPSLPDSPGGITSKHIQTVEKRSHTSSGQTLGAIPGH
jgi:hypothetical protein